MPTFGVFVSLALQVWDEDLQNEINGYLTKINKLCLNIFYIFSVLHKSFTTFSSVRYAFLNGFSTEIPCYFFPLNICTDDSILP